VDEFLFLSGRLFLSAFIQTMKDVVNFDWMGEPGVLDAEGFGMFSSV
jgi:hypothetical protein